MECDELLSAWMADNPKPLLSLQEIDGTNVFVDDVSFRNAGLSAADFLGHRWQDFTAPERHQAEQAVLDQVIYTGNNAYPQVQRDWASSSVKLINRVELIKTRNGTKLLLREGYILQPGRMPADFALDARNPMAASATVEMIVDRLKELAGLALREDWTLLHYFLEMARLQAEEQRATLIRQLLS